MVVNSYTKRIVLVAIGALVLILSLWPPTSNDRATTWAQPQSPLETITPGPTPTPTSASGPTPTPTITPTKVKRVINEISFPIAGNAVSGWTNIVGTALVDLFHRYDIHISPSGMENWQWMVSSYNIIHDDVLLRMDTTQFPDGVYDLRARAIQDSGEYTESFLQGIEIRNANPPTLTPVPGATPTPMSPLATPTPRILSRLPNGQGFYAPDNGAVLRALVDVVATVNGLPENRFVRYELAISPTGLEQWRWLHTGEEQAWQDTIYQIDTTAYADGLYDLRLRNVYEDGNYSEYYLRFLSIANQDQPQLAFVPQVGIISPDSGEAVNGIVEFIGTVPDSGLLQWELAWSPGGKEQWNFLVSNDEPLTNDLLARLDLGQLVGGLYDFRLRIVRTDNNYSDYFVRNLRLRQ